MPRFVVQMSAWPPWFVYFRYCEVTRDRGVRCGQMDLLIDGDTYMHGIIHVICKYICRQGANVRPNARGHWPGSALCRLLTVPTANMANSRRWYSCAFYETKCINANSHLAENGSFWMWGLGDRSTHDIWQAVALTIDSMTFVFSGLSHSQMLMS